MNIFYLDRDLTLNAQYHANKHLVKMITEQNQLLSTAHRILDGVKSIDYSSGRKKTFYRLSDSYRNGFLYQATHINHPSAVWVRASLEHYIWLCRSTIELCKEYTYRYSKIHAGQEKCEFLLLNPPKNIKSKGWIDPPPAMPEYCIKPDVVDSYRYYYTMEKAHLFQWKNRGKPEWA